MKNSDNGKEQKNGKVIQKTRSWYIAMLRNTEHEHTEWIVSQRYFGMKKKNAINQQVTTFAAIWHVIKHKVFNSASPFFRFFPIWCNTNFDLLECSGQKHVFNLRQQQPSSSCLFSFGALVKRQWMWIITTSLFQMLVSDFLWARSVLFMSCSCHCQGLEAEAKTEDAVFCVSQEIHPFSLGGLMLCCLPVSSGAWSWIPKFLGGVAATNNQQKELEKRRVEGVRRRLSPSSSHRHRLRRLASRVNP